VDEHGQRTLGSDDLESPIAPRHQDDLVLCARALE